MLAVNAVSSEQNLHTSSMKLFQSFSKYVYNIIVAVTPNEYY